MREDRWRPYWQNLKIENVATLFVFLYCYFPEIIRTHLVDVDLDFDVDVDVNVDIDVNVDVDVNLDADVNVDAA